MTRLTVILSLSALIGCGSSSTRPRPTQEAPLQRPPRDSGPSPASTAATVSSLDLGRALGLLDAEHPDLSELRALAEAARGRGQQGGLFPNPQLVLRMENAPWSEGSTRNEAEYVAGLTLQLPLSGRLGAAEDVGAREAELRLHELEARRRALHAVARGAFATALAAERAAQLQAQAAEFAERAVEVLRLRVDAGDTIPAELARAELEAARTRLEQRRVEGLRQRTRLELAAALGDPNLQVERLDGALEQTLQLPTLETLTRRLESNPRLLAAEADVALQAASVELAKARAVPDVSIDLFYRRLEETDENAFDAGIALPFPSFDRNQGAIRSATAERRAATERARATRNALLQALRITHARLSLQLETARVLREDVLQRAEAVRASAEARFEAGDANLAEVLPIRRDWVQIQLDYLETLRDVMIVWSELRALVPEPSTPSP